MQSPKTVLAEIRDMQALIKDLCWDSRVSPAEIVTISAQIQVLAGDLTKEEIEDMEVAEEITEEVAGRLIATYNWLHAVDAPSSYWVAKYID